MVPPEDEPRVSAIAAPMAPAPTTPMMMRFFFLVYHGRGLSATPTKLPVVFVWVIDTSPLRLPEVAFTV